MLNKKPEVLAALKTVKGVKNVFFYYPESFEKFPCISYYEINNSPFRNADDTEYLTELNYQIDIWCKTSADTSEIAGQVNDAMTGVGFVRETCYDIYHEKAPAHKTMRFRYIGG